MPGSPEYPPSPELIQPPFLLSSRFESREASQFSYDLLQTIVREQEVELSAFRLIQNWPESISKASPSTKRWYVVALGNTPSASLEQQVSEVLNGGELVALPDVVVAELVRRRSEETAKGLYVEHHHTPKFVRREDHRREKAKRTMQKNSRRRNRGK